MTSMTPRRGTVSSRDWITLDLSIIAPTITSEPDRKCINSNIRNQEEEEEEEDEEEEEEEEKDDDAYTVCTTHTYYVASEV